MAKGSLLIRGLTCLLLLLLLGCADEDETPTPTATTAVTAVTTPTSTAPPPTPTSAPTSTPSPTPVLPALTVSDQDLGEDGRLVIDSVQIPEPGWVVIHAWRDGAVAEVLGQTAVSPPAATDVTVQIDPLGATDTLIAMLHEDTGAVGTYEFPGGDQPLTDADGPITSQFNIEHQFSLPQIVVSDQVVGTNGRITINSVTVLAPSWLLVYSDNEGELGSLLGFARVDEGLNEVVSVQIPWREATAQVYAMLAADEGQPDLYDADADRLVLVGGQPIMASFTLTLPVDAFIRDQPVINNTVQIERVSMAAPGWAVIHPDDGGQPGLIIGFAFLEAGVNENVVVELLVSDATSQMYLRLHEDSGTAGEFDFPGGDGPLQVDGRVLPPITFRTDAGNYLISRDQPAGTAVTVPLAVVETSGWLAIYNNDRQSEPLGSAWLAPGINHNVTITITAGQAGDTLYAVLHADNDTPQQFDYPDGNDQPLLRNRTAVQVPFLLTP